MKFKPQLLPNDKAGEAVDWEARIQNPTDWLLSLKYDGARVELLEDGTVKGRSLLCTSLKAKMLLPRRT
jgi:hypothetical protein